MAITARHFELAIAAAPFWLGHGHANEGRAWLEQALADDAEVASESRIRGLTWLADLAFFGRRDSTGASKPALRQSTWPPRTATSQPSRRRLPRWATSSSTSVAARRLAPRSPGRSSSAGRLGELEHAGRRLHLPGRTRRLVGQVRRRPIDCSRRPDRCSDSGRPAAGDLDDPDARRVGHRTGELRRVTAVARRGLGDRRRNRRPPLHRRDSSAVSPIAISASEISVPPATSPSNTSSARASSVIAPESATPSPTSERSPGCTAISQPPGCSSRRAFEPFPKAPMSTACSSHSTALAV